MAGGGGGDDDENPVPVNCIALIDIIFCLIIFFMCSFHFKQLQGKLESHLPRDKGVNAPAVRRAIVDEIRVALDLDESGGAVVTRFGAREVGNLNELFDLVKASYDEVE